MQALEGFFSIPSKIGFADGCQRTSKEARLPLSVLALALGRLGTLLLFDFLLQRCSERVLLVDNGVGDAIPKFARFVGKLLFDGWDVFRQGEEWVKVNEEDFLLCECQ